MNYYETLYIVHPALESGRLKDIILSIQDTISDTGRPTEDGSPFFDFPYRFLFRGKYWA